MSKLYGCTQLKGSHLDDLEHAYILLLRLLLNCKHRSFTKSWSKLMNLCECAPGHFGEALI